MGIQMLVTVSCGSKKRVGKEIKILVIEKEAQRGFSDLLERG